MSKVYAVGIGPGGILDMTIRAQKTLADADVIIGYTVYVDLVKEFFPGKVFLTTPMRHEVERCVLAFERASRGETAAVICSGDAGVYGMSGLLAELAPHYPGVPLEVIPGVTAALSGAAMLGAPLMHDFAVISLSDLMTPWDSIAKRLRAAACADFVICLYNPSSQKRKDYLAHACDLILEYAAPETVCAVARNIGRDEPSAVVLSLRELRDTETDMFSTVFIGNSQTRIIDGKMVTPRGYRP